jgi:Gram-negative bacterial TonB protein C-terminal
VSVGPPKKYKSTDSSYPGGRSREYIHMGMRWYDARFRGWAILCALAAPGEAVAEDRLRDAPWPTQFEIGLHTFIDVGPPFDYYEVLIVRPDHDRASVTRIRLSPPGDACYQPAKAEAASASISASVQDVLGGVNPCAIPEKELGRERKRCKNCLVFSGENVAMRVRCGAETRLIRSDVLDRDMFDPAPHTPTHTSWTMRLLARLQEPLGAGVLDQPIVALPGKDASRGRTIDPDDVQRLSSGEYDGLFPKAPDKASEVYRASGVPAPSPNIELLRSAPFMPKKLILPRYPPIARLARVEGVVSFQIKLDPNGAVDDIVLQNDIPLLSWAVKESVRGWTFPPEAATGPPIEASIQFTTNCPKK